MTTPNETYLWADMRKKAGLTLAQAAGKSGYSIATINGLELGRGGSQRLMKALTAIYRRRPPNRRANRRLLRAANPSLSSTVTALTAMPALSLPMNKPIALNLARLRLARLLLGQVAAEVFDPMVEQGMDLCSALIVDLQCSSPSSKVALFDRILLSSFRGTSKSSFEEIAPWLPEILAQLPGLRLAPEAQPVPRDASVSPAKATRKAAKRKAK
jgi:transcriptional regulator with XRE-family HTH domain